MHIFVNATCIADLFIINISKAETHSKAQRC